MKTTQELQAEMKALQKQIRVQQIREEQERIAKLSQGKQEQETNADFEKLSTPLKEMVKKVSNQRELRKNLKAMLKLEDLTKQNYEFKIKVVRATTQEQRTLLSYNFYNPTPTRFEETQTQLEQDIASAKREYRTEENRRMRTLKNKVWAGKQKRRMVLGNIDEIVYYHGSKTTQKGYIENVMEHLTQFMTKEQAKDKLNAFLKPRLESKVARVIQEQERYIKRYNEEIKEAQENIVKMKAIQVGSYV